MFLIVKVEFNFKRWSAMVTCPSDVKILNKTCAIHLDPPHKDLKASFVFLKEMIIFNFALFQVYYKKYLTIDKYNKTERYNEDKEEFRGVR